MTNHESYCQIRYWWYSRV